MPIRKPAASPFLLPALGFALLAAVPVLAPRPALADAGCSEQVRMSCAAGTVWDERTASCVTTSS